MENKIIKKLKESRKKKAAEIEASKLERIQRKASYDAWNVVMEGQRRTQIETENIVKGLLNNYTESDEAVKDLLVQESELTHQIDVETKKLEDQLKLETKTESDES